MTDTRGVDGGRYAGVMAPISLGPLALRNRVFVPAHTTNFGAGHLPTERHLEYHRARAAGGVGAIVFESIRVHPNTLGRPAAVAGCDSRCIEPLRRIGEAVRAEGARLLGQVIHLGRHIDGDFERTVSWGASPIPWAATASPPHVMNEDEMAEAIDAHVATARHLVQAGLDGIELQMGHGHLLQQFLSPLSNTRDDAYGGSLRNRLRFPAAVLAAVRAEVGSGVCLGIRVSGDEFTDGGLRLEESVAIVEALVSQTPVDFVDVSHSAYHGSPSLATQMADMAHDPAPFRELPRVIRAHLHATGHPVPVLAVCRFTTLEEADAAICDGVADAVGMARAHLAEPALVRKTLAGRRDEVAPCIACNQGCAGMLEKNVPITCVVNPRAGREQTWPEPVDDPTATPRRVLVVGGGPAGMEAAWVAAARGHEVALWEAGDRLGGQLQLAAALTGRREWRRLLDHQRRALGRHGVQITTGIDATTDVVLDHGAEVIVTATGSVPVIPHLPGGGEILDLPRAIARGATAGEAIVIADLTGEWAALSVIEHLAGLGAGVTVLTPVAAFAWRTTIYSTLATTARLRRLGVRIAPLRRPVGWDGTSVRVRDESTGHERTLDGVDAIVVAAHGAAEDRLGRELRERGARPHQIGDCVAPRTALEAIFQGHALARSL